MKKILFITTNNLTTNPRLYKELKLARGHYETAALLFELGNWSDALDKQLIPAISKTDMTYLPGHRGKMAEWLFLSVLNKAFHLLWPFFKKNLFISAVASSKRTLQLWWYLRKHADRYKDVNLIIAHNLGALFPAYFIAKALKLPYSFDVEDYHPGERIERDSENEKTRREFQMKSMLPEASLVTAASPLIGEQVENLCGVKVTCINNTFFSSEFNYIECAGIPKVNLVWFSQHINYGRGLELCLPVLDKLSEHITLTLIGNLNQKFGEECLKSRSYIKVIAPMDQKALHQELCRFDVGLALELRSADFNREIALTNKIFAYLQAGLFVIATNTKAQTQLLQQYPAHGVLCEQTEASLREQMEFAINKIQDIRAEKYKRFETMRNLSYENEGNKLLNLWSAIIKRSS